MNKKDFPDVTGGGKRMEGAGANSDRESKKKNVKRYISRYTECYGGGYPRKN